MRVIYTSYDESTGYWKLCEPSVLAWVKKCGAVLVNLPKPIGYQPQWVLFDAFMHSAQDPNITQSVWIDCDIVVRGDAPNPFEGLPEAIHFCQPDPAHRVHPRMLKTWRKHGISNPRPYFVTALVMWAPHQVLPLIEWFDTERDRFTPRDGDQELITVAMQELRLYAAYFPPHWHKMSKFVNDKTMFLHAAGRKVKKRRRLRIFFAWMKKHGYE